MSPQPNSETKAFCTRFDFDNRTQFFKQIVTQGQSNSISAIYYNNSSQSDMFFFKDINGKYSLVEIPDKSDPMKLISWSVSEKFPSQKVATTMTEKQFFYSISRENLNTHVLRIASPENNWSEVLEKTIHFEGEILEIAVYSDNSLLVLAKQGGREMFFNIPKSGDLTDEYELLNPVLIPQGYSFLGRPLETSPGVYQGVLVSSQSRILLFQYKIPM